MSIDWEKSGAHAVASRSTTSYASLAAGLEEDMVETTSTTMSTTNSEEPSGTSMLLGSPPSKDPTNKAFFKTLCNQYNDISRSLSPTTSACSTLLVSQTVQANCNDDSCTATSSNNVSLLSPAVSKIDQLSTLPDDVWCKITGFLDASSLGRLSAVNRQYHQLACRNCAGWEHLCQQLWQTRVHVLPTAQNDCNKMRAYRMSLLDARQRSYVLPDEFCFDEAAGRGTVWSFRFKESAGVDWTSVDPWYNGMPCRKMVFFKDGSVKQFIPLPENYSRDGNSPAALPFHQGTSTRTNGDEDDDLLWNNNNNNINFLLRQEREAILRASTLAAGSTSGLRIVHTADGTPGCLIDPPMKMTWRFLTRPMDLPTRAMGSYVRFSVGGRDVPTYSVRRSPTGNWGFLMESCWGLYASFELPPKRKNTQQSLQRRQRLRRTREAGDELPDSAEESLPLLAERHAHSQSGSWPTTTVGDRAATQHGEEDNPDSLLQDDSNLIITNDIQWREAFLYNVGARILPEGDQATDEFDRAWGGL